MAELRQDRSCACSSLAELRQSRIRTASALAELRPDRILDCLRTCGAAAEPDLDTLRTCGAAAEPDRHVLRIGGAAAEPNLDTLRTFRAVSEALVTRPAEQAGAREGREPSYDGLLGGGGRSEALRQVQLAMLNNPERAHPYYWASFIVSGNPAALDGNPVAPAKVPPGVRGCTCEVGGDANMGAEAWAAVGAAIVLVGRLRRRSARGAERASTFRLRRWERAAEAAGSSAFCEDLVEW